MSSPEARHPVYFDLFRRMERDIVEGKYKKGDLLPSDIDLAKQFDVSRYVAREVYSELVRRHLVTRVRRKGTQVTYDRETARVRKIGLILLADVPSYYLFEKGVEEVLGKRGAGLYVQYSYDDEKLNAKALEEALAHDVEGLIISPPPQSSFEPYKQLIARGFPVVLALASNPGVTCVFPDDYKAGRLVGEHFGQAGIKRPAVVTQAERQYAQERLYGFREGIARHGLHVDDDRIIPAKYFDEQGRYQPDIGRKETLALLAMKPRPDAVFAVNDLIATSIYFWLLNLGVRVPQDVAVAGVDTLGSRFHPFPLTSVDIGLEEMGRKSAELLLQQLQSTHAPIVQKKVEPRLVIGASTAKKRR